MSQVVTMNGYKHLLVGVACSWNIFIPSSNLRACLGGLLTEGSLCGAGAEATELVFCGFFVHGKKRLQLLYHGSRSRFTAPPIWWSSSSEADVARVGAGAEAPLNGPRAK
jgi:hypothetical protein